LWDAEALEGLVKVEKVGPSGVSRDESSGDVEPGVVVESEQESLFCGPWPPLVDGTIVLEEFTESGATKAAIGAWLFSR
jgi:hypothetical protein